MLRRRTARGSHAPRHATDYEHHDDQELFDRDAQIAALKEAKREAVEVCRPYSCALASAQRHMGGRNAEAHREDPAAEPPAVQPRGESCRARLQ